MNKAKVILSGLAVFAVVGGALAFNVKKFTQPKLYSVTTTTTALGGPVISYCTTSPFNSIAGTPVVAAGLFTSITTTNTTTTLICSVPFTSVTFVDGE